MATSSISKTVATTLCRCTLGKLKQRYPSMASSVGKVTQQEVATINQQCYQEVVEKKTSKGK